MTEKKAQLLKEVLFARNDVLCNKYTPDLLTDYMKSLDNGGLFDSLFLHGQLVKINFM